MYCFTPWNAESRYLPHAQNTEGKRVEGEINLPAGL